jgi:hypothetical protein
VRATFYTWKSEYGWMGVYEARRLKSLEDENRRLKHPVADLKKYLRKRWGLWVTKRWACKLFLEFDRSSNRYVRALRS